MYMPKNAILAFAEFQEIGAFPLPQKIIERHSYFNVLHRITFLLPENSLEIHNFSCWNHTEMLVPDFPSSAPPLVLTTDQHAAIKIAPTSGSL